MLKGLKKSKPNNEQNFQEKDIQINNLVSKQKNLKNKFIMEDNYEYDNYQPSFAQQQKYQNQQIYIIKNQDQQIKNKAIQIMKLFQKGNQIELKQKIQQFQKFQSKYLQKNQKNKPFNNKQEQILKLPQKQKGKFQYTMNFQSQQQQDQTKINSKKRSSKSRPIMKSQRVQQYCIYCPDNQQLKLISASNYVYLALNKRKTFKKYWHFILAPVQHQQSLIGLNQDILTEITNYKKCLLQMFDKKNYLVVFFQQFYQQNLHIFTQCLVIPYDKAQDFPFFFKQALDTVQGNWTTHKNIIKIQKEKGGLQKQIPKKMKYFYIDFSLGYGYAHVIQNQKFWKKDFAYEIFATALNVQLYEIKTAAQYTDQQLEVKQTEFSKLWDAYDWTKCI